MPADERPVQLSRIPMPRGRFRYRAEARVGRHEHLVLRASDGEVVVRWPAAKAVRGVLAAEWIDERDDLTPEVVSVG